MKDPERALIVTGCAATMDPAAFAAMPEVEALVDNRAKTAVATWQDATWIGGSRPEVSSDLAPTLQEGTEDHTRAFLAIQNGCDHDCTFCAIPLGRGASRSAPLADVVASAARIAASGFREIVLTGRRSHLLRRRPARPAEPRPPRPARSSRAHQGWRACGCPPSIASRPTRSFARPSPRRSGSCPIFTSRCRAATT